MDAVKFCRKEQECVIRFRRIAKDAAWMKKNR